QLLVIATGKAALRVRDPFELRLDLLEPRRIGLERGEEGPQRARRLAEPKLRVAKLRRCLSELRREPFDRGKHAFGGGDEPRGALALLGRERLRRGRRGSDQLAHAQQPLALGAESLFLP